MKIGYHTHVWNGKEFPGVNVWCRRMSFSFSEKRFAFYILGWRLINWEAR